MKNRKLQTGILLAVLLLTVVGCVSNEGDETATLDGTKWVLMTIRKSRPIPETAITISFKEGELGGSAGCNSYFSGYTTEEDQIQISAIGMTEMACMQPEGVMEQEMEYLQHLQGVERFTIEGNTLSLIRPDRETLTFERIFQED